MISEVKDLKELTTLQKLYLSGNKITSFEQTLPSLIDLTLENNPIDRTFGIIQVFKQKFPALQYYNLQKVSTFDVR